MLHISNHEEGFDTFESERGVHRVLSLMPPKPKAMQRVADAFPIIDRKDWVVTNRLASLGDKVARYDQGQIGSCEPHAEVECLGGLRAIAGMPKVAFSASMLYALINDGADRGAAIGDGYRYLQQFGVCTRETMPEGLYRRSGISAAAYAEAKNYRAIVAYHCPTFEEIVTAHLHGCWVCHGVTVGTNFNNLDDDGVAPQPRNSSPNHAVSMWDLRRRKNGEWYFWDLNHWRLTWGVKGDFGTTEEAYNYQRYQDAIAYRVVSHDAGDTIPVAD